MSKWKVTRTWYVDAEKWSEALEKARSFAKCVETHAVKLTEAQYIKEMAEVFKNE